VKNIVVRAFPLERQRIPNCEKQPPDHCPEPQRQQQNQDDRLFFVQAGGTLQGPGTRSLRAYLVADLGCCGVAHFDNPGQKVDRADPFATLGFRWSPAGDGGAFFLPPLAGHDEIGIPNAAFGTAQQPRPIDDRHPRAVLGNQCGWVGLSSVIAALAPHGSPATAPTAIPIRSDDRAIRRAAIVTGR
jgi:hypothetical protein